MSQDEATGIARAVERVRRSRRKGLKFALPTVAALGAGTALAVGAIPGGGGTITGCYLTNPDQANEPLAHYGSLRVIDPSVTAPAAGVPNYQGACQPYEATITWNQHGPQGPPGVPGAQGPQGPQGAAGQNLVGQTSFGFGGGGGAGNTFLKLDGIKGESVDHKHKGEIEISSFSFGVTNPGANAHGSGGGAGAGKTTFQSFTITKKLDKSSPALFLDAASGKHIKFADVSFAKKSKGKVQDYLEIKMNDVLISSLQQGQSPHGTPTESITFNFKKAEELFLGSSGKVVQSVAITISGNKGA